MHRNPVKTDLQPAAVLFDLDGTLIDTAPDFIRCLNRLRRHHGLPPLPPEHIRRSVSNGARAMVRLGFGLEPGQPGYEQKHADFLDLYEAEMAVETTLFDGMERLLASLEARSIPWGIVTNKPVRFAAPLIRALDLSERCATLVCPDHVSQRKPHPEPLLLACRQLGVAAHDSLYVGDHERDIEAGRRAGMHTVAVRYGYIEDPESVPQWQADFIADSVKDLTNLLQ